VNRREQTLSLCGQVANNIYKPVLQRLDEPHLRGYDPAKAPTFRWPPEVIEAYNRIEAEEANKRKRKKEKAARE